MVVVFENAWAWESKVAAVNVMSPVYLDTPPAQTLPFILGYTT
jgi:hypothetical protein